MKKEKTVSFNLKDKREKRMYEYACSVNFSGLVKSLLFHYMQNEGVFGSTHTPPTLQHTEHAADEQETADLIDMGLPFDG